MILNFKTYQEITLQGGTLNEEEKPSNPYIPLGVARGTLSIEEAQKLREETGHFSSIPLQGALKFPFDEITVSYEDINPDTGETIRDPKVLGIYDRAKKTIVGVEGRDLNAEARKIIKKWGRR